MVVKMQNSFYSSTFSNSMGTCSEMEVKYHHKIDSKLRIVKNRSNYGKKFHVCFLWPVCSQNFVFCLT